MSVVGLGWWRSSLLSLALLQVGRAGGGAGRFRYERSIEPAGRGTVCAVLDAAVFAHAAGSLKDVRLFREGRELPYAIAVNEAAQAGNDAAAVVNLREDSRGAEFDLAMPPRAYTQVLLQMEGKDFIARGEVWGADRPGPVAGAGKSVPLGKIALFDLTTRGLGRATIVSLQESSFRYLHVVLRGGGFRVVGAEVPPSREGQTLFTAVAETLEVSQRGDETIARFRVAARVPVERVEFRLAKGFTGNFSRAVRVTATADAPGSDREQVTGRILRVKTEGIQAEQETIPASLGANLQADATVEVAIENVGREALPVAAVTLAMRRRTLCFDAAGPVMLRYGDTSLDAPDYAYQPGSRWRLAVLGPEKTLPDRRGSGQRPHGGRRPMAFAALGLLAGLALAGRIAFQHGLVRRRGRSRSGGKVD